MALMRRAWVFVIVMAMLVVTALVAARQAPQRGRGPAATAQETDVSANASRMLEEGRRTFRYDTFGDEAFWGDTLKLHAAIAGARNGGVGPGVSPKTALSVGLKVDMDAVPAPVVAGLRAGTVNLDDPANTLALLKANAVVGVTGRFNGDRLQSIGIQCAFCHSTVDDAFMPGIGHRLDGYANRDLNVGAIVALSPDLSAYTKLLAVDEATVKKVLSSWGPGKFDAELNLDGKAFRPDGKPAATLIPAAYGLAGVNLHTWTGGWGGVTYWNAYVANLEMQGRGAFWDPRLTNAKQYPVAARSGFGNKRSSGPDMVTAKLAALEFYQLAIPTPKPKPGSFDTAAATRGQSVFGSKAKCSTCHVPPLFTEPGWNVHKPSEIGIDDFQSERSPDHTYRTAPLRALMSHAKGGFYHDGRFADLRAVVDHYDGFLKLALSDTEKRDLIEYLKSL